jgi:hypothetical protein
MIRCYIHLHLYLTWNYLSKLMSFLFHFFFQFSAGNTGNTWRIYLNIYFIFSRGQSPCKILIGFCQRFVLYDVFPAIFFKFISSWCFWCSIICACLIYVMLMLVLSSNFFFLSKFQALLKLSLLIFFFT